MDLPFCKTYKPSPRDQMMDLERGWAYGEGQGLRHVPGGDGRETEEEQDSSTQSWSARDMKYSTQPGL